jgi:glutamine---fructose-6-phosphate transaminase (isomerizing)
MRWLVDRCDTCVVPRTSRSVTFDGDTCSLCVASRSAVVEPPDPGELERLIERVKSAGRDRPHDCVVGVSGGRDSTYLLHQLVRRHGLRCLAAYHRTPFTPDVIDGNVRRATRELGVPLVEMDIPHAHHRTWAKRAVMLWLRKPSPVVASLACAPCKQHNREVLRVARRHQVAFLAMGSNRYEAVQVAVSHTRMRAGGRPGLAVKLRQSMTLARKGTVALARSRELWPFVPVGVKAALYLSPDAPFLRFAYRGIETFNYFYLAPWDEAECEAVLRDLGWEQPSNCPSSWRADCAFTEIKNRIFTRTSGMDYVDAFFSNRIRAGDLDRDEALRRLAIEGRPSQHRLEEACSMLGVPADLFAEPAELAEATA